MDVKIIVTLGPSTNTEEHLRKIKAKGVDFVRINMSHSTLDDLKYFLSLSQKVGLPFIIDTEGSQIRSGDLISNKVYYTEGSKVKIHKGDIVGDSENICLKPEIVLEQLKEGDLIYIDFDTLVLQVLDVSTLSHGYVMSRVVVGGEVGKNKGVVVDSGSGKKIILPTLSEKDHQSIAIGLANKVEHIAMSFARSGKSVDTVKKATNGSMKIISKIECLDALENLDEIIDKSDYLLIDRGDLSKEIPIEKIPFTQKIILHKAKSKNKEVFVATNLLETMIEKKKPTRAEVHDVITTILDGAAGLTLAGEAAIGKHPMECINMLKKLIRHAQLALENKKIKNNDNGDFVKHFDATNYLLDMEINSGLPEPHGGKLVDRVLKSSELPAREYLESLPKIVLNDDLQMDAEQIATGVFSPLEGFMNKDDFNSVLDSTRLKNGVIWPIPIVLDVPADQAEGLKIGQKAALADSRGDVIAILDLDEKFNFDKKEMSIKLYGTEDKSHPGVKRIESMNPVLLGGKIFLVSRRKSKTRAYELTPRQIRRLFNDLGWSNVVGFHTRNVIHRSHEYIQLQALKRTGCDGLLIHPVVGKKKVGDFNADFIIKSYAMMLEKFYPKGKVVLAAFATYSRYAGPREAVFTAICRKNYGCSSFIVGRDHTGVGNFYSPKASHTIFDQLPDLGMEIIKFDNVFYSKKKNFHVTEAEVGNDHSENDKLYISGTQARKMLENGIEPPEWFMRPEISRMITAAIKNNEEVFVKEPTLAGKKVIWFTGLSGSGKTTLAEAFKKDMEFLGKKAEIIDGDVVRSTLNRHLGFSREDIRENNRFIAGLARKKIAECDYVLVPVISPFKDDRSLAKGIIGPDRFTELFVDCPVSECSNRDTKGLYRKAEAGEIKNLIGVSEGYPYEVPENPSITLHTSKMSVNECLNIIKKHLNLC
ncbi:MAG: sulfate adenylyltransferase [Minisyncoccia bacterium]